MASVLASTLSTTSLAALSSFLSSRSTCSTIFPWASMPTYRDKEIDFKIAEKYYCWKQNKSSWKNQYLSSQEGEGGGLCRSVPAPHQTGRSSNLNVSGSSCDLPVQGLRVIWNFSSTQKSRLLPPTWERLDCRHCKKTKGAKCTLQDGTLLRTDMWDSHDTERAIPSSYLHKFVILKGGVL